MENLNNEIIEKAINLNKNEKNKNLLNNGVAIAFFQSSGICLDNIHLLNNLVRICTSFTLVSLMILVGISEIPGPLAFDKLSNNLLTIVSVVNLKETS